MNKRKNDIPCWNCGGRMKKKPMGYDCLNCEISAITKNKKKYD